MEENLMKKSKGKTVDLLYTNKAELKKTKNVGKTGNNSKNGKKNKEKNKQSNNKETINLDNEIIIGLTPKKQEQEKKEKKQINKKKSGKKTKNVGENSSRSHKNSKITKKNSKQKKSKQTKKYKIIKWTTIISFLIIAIIMFMMSSIFNIKQIIVSNNNKISSEEIINLSKLQIETNMFKTSNRIINNNVKTNPYIENVKVLRKLNGTITLEIQERVPTYMLKFGNSYVYINNQGYMLEITEKPLELPTITGFETITEEIKEGNRLVINDLKKLEEVIKIIESAKSNSLEKMINNIDITNQGDYSLTIESENKVVRFGDITNANIKMLKIEEIIQQEKGVAGEIYFQDSEKTVFRETVNF